MTFLFFTTLFPFLFFLSPFFSLPFYFSYSWNEASDCRKLLQLCTKFKCANKSAPFWPQHAQKSLKVGLTGKRFQLQFLLFSLNVELVISNRIEPDAEVQKVARYSTAELFFNNQTPLDNRSPLQACGCGATTPHMESTHGLSADVVMPDQTLGLMHSNERTAVISR